MTTQPHAGRVRTDPSAQTKRRDTCFSSTSRPYVVRLDPIAPEARHHQVRVRPERRPSCDQQTGILEDGSAGSVVVHERWLTKKQLAEHLSVTPRWIEYQQRLGLPHLRMGGLNRYRISQVEAWLLQHYPPADTAAGA